MNQQGKSEISSTVQRAIRIINYLHEVPGPQALSDMAKALQLSPTIVHRLLTTLKIEGFVFQDPRSKLYSLGTIFLDYANKIMTEMPIAPIIEPWLSKLRDITGETVGFYLPTGNSRICAMEYESQQEIRRIVGVGKRYPLYVGASGRAILAFMSQDVQNQILSVLTPEHRKAVQERLKQTVNDGYTTNEEEITPNVGALSAPIFDQNGRVIGAVSISGPVFRWNRNTMEPFIAELLKATESISESFK